MKRALPWLLGAVLLVSVASSSVRLEKLHKESTVEESLLYLPNGQHLKLMSLGQEALLADAVYLWAIQYYSAYGRADRFQFVEHIFSRVIPDLDPNYLDPYWIGAMIMTTEARDLDAGLRIFERGIAANPDKWLLPYLAAWECFQFEQYDRAEKYFAQAAAVEDAPPVVLRLRAGMSSKAGNYREAIKKWGELIEDPKSDGATRAIAARQVRDLTVKADLKDLNGLAKRYHEKYRRWPRGTGDLMQAGWLKFDPLDPDGNSYRWDQSKEKFTSGASRLLGDR